MLLDILVHAAGVRFHHLARFGVEERGISFSSPSKAVGSKLSVDEKRSGSQDFRKLPAGGAAQQIHLPEAILRHDVALGLREIFHRGGADVGHAPEVTVDGDLVLQTGQGSAPVDLRQGAVDIPPS